jgi:transposase
MEQATVVGIDVSKDRLDVHVLPSGEAWAVSRDAAGLAELCQRLAGAGIVALEATGGYETIAVATLSSAGLPVVVVNPAQVRAYAKALGQRAKTDPIDAHVIARFAEATKPEVRPLPDQATRLLADLLARRRQIVEMMVSENQRLQRTEVPRVRKSIERLLAALKRELGGVDHDIDDSVRGSPVWRQKEDLLISVKGVGRIIARTIVADLPELGTLGRKRIGALVGLAPFVRQSGRWKGQSHIGGGRPAVRTALFLGAQVAKRHNPVLKAFYQRLLAAGKPKMVATIAVAHKLLTILNAILRDGKPWQPA